PRDPARRAVHPPRRVRPQRGRQPLDRAADDARDLDRGDAHARRRAVPQRARGKADRRAAARVEGAARVTTAEKYIAAAYAVFVVALLLYVAIIALKLA